MTSLSFILGALPLVTASGAGANSRHSIGTGVIGGMIGATTLALFYVPLFYFLLVGFKDKLGGRKPTLAADGSPLDETATNTSGDGPAADGDESGAEEVTE
jgi:multidrug efflux pump